MNYIAVQRLIPPKNILKYVHPHKLIIKKKLLLAVTFYSKWALEHSLNRFSPPGLCLTRSKPPKLICLLNKMWL